MKKNLLFMLLLIMAISFSSSLFAQVEVTIGQGTQVNTTTGSPAPYGTWYKAFRQQYIVLASELNNQGGGPGNITSVAFNVETLNNITPMNNFRIRLKHTTQTVLTSTFEAGDYQVVYQQTTFTPVVGWNTHTFSTPFNWNGGSNLLVEVVTDLIAGDWAQNASAYYTATTYASSLRFQSDTANGDTGTTGTTANMRSNMRFTMQQLDMQDMAALSISGNTTPSVGTLSNYIVRVKNLSPGAQSNYTVKLMAAPNTELTSVPGTALNSMAEADFTLGWTPTTVGPIQIFGSIVFAGDENPTNNNTANLNLEVQPADVVTVQVGTGTSVNGDTGSPAPYGTWYKAFREQYLYKASEIYAAGGAPGLISSLAFNVQNVGQCTAMTNYRIRLKHTTQEALTSTFEAGEYQTVFQAGSFMPVNGWNVHPLSDPFFWNGGDNLIVEVVTDVCAGDYARNALVYYSSPGFNSSLRFQSDSSSGDTGSTGTTSPNRSNVRLFLSVDDMGSLSGTVTTGGAPLAGVTITVDNTVFSATTAADGTYNLPFVNVGAQTVTASKHGYVPVSHNVTIVDGQNTVQNFALNLLPQVTVTGRIVGSDAPTLGIADATIALSGYEPYTATTNAQGQFTITNVFASQTYNYVVNALGYAAANGTVAVGTTNVNMGDITVNEVAFPPYQVVAEEINNFQNAQLNWQAPNPQAGGEWLSYHGENDGNSIGTGGAADFDVAIRFPASALADYAGMSLYAVKAWPHEQNSSYSVRVWTGGTASAPGTMVVDQPFTHQIGSFNTIILNNPVTITGTEELWFGFRCNTQTGYPAACDEGPAINGFGNMMYFQGEWDTLLGIAPSLNYNWMIQGYVGFGEPDDRGEVIVLNAKPGLKDDANRISHGTLSAKDTKLNLNPTPAVYSGHKSERADMETRALVGYKVWRFLAADQQNENNWTSLTASPITPVSYTDATYGPLPSGVYKYAVKAIYTNNVASTPAFSNELHKGMMGTLTGTITEFGTNIPIEGVTVRAGDYSGLTNAQGVYSFAVYAGNYTVQATKVGYQAGSQPGVVIVGLQTTTQNFVLTEITLPPAAVQAEEAGNNVNITWMAPGAGEEMTEGFEGDFPPTDWSQTINNNNEGGAGVMATWCKVGTIALDPAVTPHGGAYQAAVWWDYSHQDEWLITPAFNCLPGASLTAWSYVYYGSTNGDHYYVKVSTDNGATWSVLWDASTLTGGWNYYQTPIQIDLSDFGGQEIKLAFQAEDPASNDGLWYVWFLDDIHIGTPERTIRFGREHLSRARLDDNNRAQEGYKVWRLIQGQESNEAAWTALTPNPISATAFQDTGWNAVPDGMYKWAVKAVYTGGALSQTAFSNPLPKATQVGTIAGFVRDMQNQPINGATVTANGKTGTSNASGAYSIQGVAQGTHSATATHPNYSAVTINNIIVVTGQITTVNFQLPPSSILLEDSFESYPDFALTFAPWVLVDGDQAPTYGFSGITFPNSGSAMAYIIFNPNATSPTTDSAVPHSGQKMAASFAATTPPNNDWMISPVFTGGGKLTFWARSFVADYGLERFKVGVSTGGTAPADFTIISGGNYIQAPVDWTEYTYNLEAYANQDIRIAIQCVSNDAFIFFVDDVKIEGPDDNEDLVAPVYTTELKGNFPNPFNPETTIRYSVKDQGPVSIDIYNVKGQLVRNLVNTVKDAGEFSAVWNGTDNNGRAVSSGVYYFKMNAGKYSSTKKMIMMK